MAMSPEQWILIGEALQGGPGFGSLYDTFKQRAAQRKQQAIAEDQRAKKQAGLDTILSAMQGGPFASPEAQQEALKMGLLQYDPDAAIKQMTQTQKPVSMQFGSQETFKDSEGNLYLGTTQRDPSTGSVKSVLAPVGGAPETPVGQVSMVSGLGLTAAEESRRKVRTAEEVEGAKLGAQLKIKPQIQSQIKQAELEAKSRNEILTDLGKAKAALPGLKDMTARLKTLADVATYTKAGQAWNAVVKELGFGSTKGGTARTTMEAIVNNEVLPLLKATFGGSFTITEGESLKATLMDVNKSPEEKKASLDVFIDKKMRDIEAKELEAGMKKTDAQIFTLPNGVTAKRIK